MPGGAAHTGAMACTACIAVPRQPWSFSSSPCVAIFASSTIDGRPSTVTFHPRPRGQSGASPSAKPGDVLDRERGPAVDDGGGREAHGRDRARLDATGGDVERLLGDGNLAVVDEVVDRGAEAVGHEHQRRAERAAEQRGSAPGTSASGGRPKPMMSNSMSVLAYVE